MRSTFRLLVLCQGFLLCYSQLPYMELLRLKPRTPKSLHHLKTTEPSKSNPPKLIKAEDLFFNDALSDQIDFSHNGGIDRIDRYEDDEEIIYSSLENGDVEEKQERKIRIKRKKTKFALTTSDDLAGTSGGRALISNHEYSPPNVNTNYEIRRVKTAPTIVEMLPIKLSSDKIGSLHKENYNDERDKRTAPNFLNSSTVGREGRSLSKNTQVSGISNDLSSSGSHNYIKRRKLTPEEKAKARANKIAKSMYYNGLDHHIGNSNILSDTARLINSGKFEDLFRNDKKIYRNPKPISSTTKKPSYRQSKSIGNKTPLNSIKPITPPKQIKNQNKYPSFKDTEKLITSSNSFTFEGFKPHPLYSSLKKLPNYPKYNSIFNEQISTDLHDDFPQSEEKYTETVFSEPKYLPKVDPEPKSKYYFQPKSKSYFQPKSQNTPVINPFQQFQQKRSTSYPVFEKVDEVESKEDEYVKLYIPVRAKALPVQKASFNEKSSLLSFPPPTTFRPQISKLEEGHRLTHYKSKYLHNHNAYHYVKHQNEKLRYLPPLYDIDEPKFFRDPVLNPLYLQMQRQQKISQPFEEIRPKQKAKVQSHPQLQREKVVPPPLGFQESPSSEFVPEMSRKPKRITYVRPHKHPRSYTRQERTYGHERMIDSNVRFPKYGYDIDKYFEGFPKFGFFESSEEFS